MSMKQRATIICRRGNQFLYVRRANSKWNLPGGKLERSELPRAAAFRELKEETGLEPYEMIQLARFDSGSVEHFLFLAEFGNDYFTPAPLSEITKCRWLPSAANGLRLTTEAKRILSTFMSDIDAL